MKIATSIHSVVFIAALCTSVQGQHQHDHRGTEQIGTVRFQTSCSGPARKQFDKAVAWLHSFEYDESERAFKEVARIDPDCGMAYWGVAMSLYHPLWAPPTRLELERGSAAVANAERIGARTRREQDYIQAIAAFYRNWDRLDYPSRASAYESAMKQVYERYPSDREAAVFYALALNSTAMVESPPDKSYARQKKAAGILNRVLRIQPSHPGVAHYLIHSYDYPELAPLALDAARRYAKIAPSSSHALHMPSHIFTRMGLWNESIAMNRRAESAAKSFAERNHLKGAWDEQLHAMDYLAYAFLQLGRNKDAHAVLDQLRAIHQTEPENFKCAYAFAAIPARWVLERRAWTEAAALTIAPSSFPWSRFPWAESITYFARALGAARTGEQRQARDDIDRIASLRAALSNSKENYDWATQVEIQHRAASAWLAKAAGETDNALRLMRSAADLEDSTDKHPVTPGAVVPARELLGEMLLEWGRADEALREFERALADSPNRFNGLLGAAQAAEKAGNRVKAANYYRTLLVICGQSSDRPELEAARRYLKRLGPQSPVGVPRRSRR